MANDSEIKAKYQAVEAAMRELGAAIGRRDGGEIGAEDDFKSARWFEKTTTISAERLRKAAAKGRKGRRVRRRNNDDGMIVYSVLDALRNWPDDFRGP